MPIDPQEIIYLKKRSPNERLDWVILKYTILFAENEKMKQEIKELQGKLSKVSKSEKASSQAVIFVIQTLIKVGMIKEEKVTKLELIN
jgi:cell division septum initiation protein DivIVA